ncbi:hypothetical protein AAL_07809 [Moelleriella libera RCEF 2490]|uniref:Uncharacterized protein n=1 Tax=Moelleriella libera RCEF 2490 TaxID=1081109 RepID=A0A167WQX4_9HYPO|nr:hypothetical protein AAL_07809 [Moelleriella libera RCEF 2490]
MPVWSEPARHRANSTPGIHRIHRDAVLNNTVFRIYAIAQAAAESLDVLSLDAYMVVTGTCNQGMLAGNPFPLPGGADNDPWDLVLFLIYYSHLVLGTVRRLVAPQLMPTVNNVNIFNAFVQNVQNIAFSALLAASHLRGLNIFQIQVDQVIVNFKQGLDATINPGQPCPQMSGLGTVELLCRVLARGCQNMSESKKQHGVAPFIVSADILFSSQDNFDARVQQLRLVQLPRPRVAARLGCWDFHNKAIPHTVFVCTGSNGAAANPPTIVVTTSQDVWGAFTTMQNFATRCRQPLRRLDWNGVGANRDSMNIRGASRNLRTAYRNAVAGLPAPVTPINRQVARGAVRNQYLVQFNALHTNECATPFSCPSFRPKARCLRCQGLFDYNVQPIVWMTNAEIALRMAQELKCHLKLACAECIAHYACRHAKANHGLVVNGQVNH